MSPFAPLSPLMLWPIMAMVVVGDPDVYVTTVLFQRYGFAVVGVCADVLHPVSDADGAVEDAEAR